MIDLSTFVGFQWDEGNIHKNWIKHGVDIQEAQQVFKNKPNLISPDILHSESEPRYHILGKTDSGRRLLLSFTVRQKHIRVISARPMNKKERDEYEKA